MYTLTFTEEQLYLLNTAIGEMPHKHAAPLIQAINEQILAQRPADQKTGEGQQEGA
jgi:hypothetical protein